MQHPLPARNIEPGVDDLVLLNREPVSFLADIAARDERVPYEAAFYEAQSVVLQHGSSRRIDRDSATLLCRQMQEWARSYCEDDAPKG